MADVKFKFIGDDSDLRKKLANIARMQSEMTEKFNADLNKTISNGLAKAMKETAKETSNAAKQAEVLGRITANNNLRDAKLSEIETIKKLRAERSKEISDLNILKQIEQEAKVGLAEKKNVTESLIQAEKQKRIEYQQGRKDLAEYSLELKRSAEERRKATEEERKAEKVLRDTEKARKDAEREAVKQSKEAAKRKKQLEQENSEYEKLNRALGKVRKETKDVLAEMFRLERQGYKNSLGYEALAKKADALTKQTNVLDRGIKKIDASLGLHQRNVGNYGDALELVSPQIASINQKLSLLGTSLDDLAGKPGAIKELGAAFMSMGKGILSFLVSPIGLAITAFAALFALFKGNKQTVIDFNNGLLNVSKTTGLAGLELQAMADAIVKLSRSLQTVSTAKLLEYATIAGQLGVKGTDNIMNFTEALAKLETASDISGEKGGAEIARMLTLVDGGVQNVKAFGDEIVNLGNNFAATESEILANAEAISQNTGLYRVGRQDVLAYATATKSLGIEAEVVGSTFQKTLSTFEKSIRSGKGVADILKVVGGSSAELQRRFREDASGVFQDYIKGLNGIFKAGGSVQAQLEKNGITDIRQTRVIGTLATGYDTLARAMDTVKNASGALQEEFETASGKLVNQTQRIGIAWDNLVLSVENGSGAIGKASVAIIGTFADILEGVTKLVTSTSWKEFFVRWGGLSGNRGDRATADVLGEYYKLASDTENQNDKSIVPYKAMREFYRASVTDQERMLKNQEGIFELKKKEYQLDSTNAKKRDDFLYSSEKLAKMRSKIGGKAVVNPTTGIVEPDTTLTDKAKREAEALQRQQEQAFERQRSLQLKIDQLNAESSRNAISRDQQEIESIRDKYAKIREEIEKFNRDSRNKGQKVNSSGLAQAEGFEISEATTRQETVALVASLDAQKAIYDEYNAYVKQSGVESAKEMFGAQAELAKDYKERLQKEYLDIIALQQTASDGGFAGASGSLTQAQEERAKALKAMLDAIAKQEEVDRRQRLAEALKATETFAQAELRIRKRYSDLLTDLGEYASDEQREILKKGLQEDLQALVESSPEFQKVLEEIDDSSQWLLASAFKNGKESIMKMIDGMEKATKEEKSNLKKLFGDFFDKGITDAEAGNYEAVESLVQGFGSLVDMATKFDGSMSNSLKTIGSMVSQVGQLAKSIGDTLGSVGKGMSSAGGIGGIVGAVFSMVGGIVEAMENSIDRKIQKEKENLEYQNNIQIKQIDSITRALEYQLEIIKDIYGAERVTKYADVVRNSYNSVNESIKSLGDKAILTNSGNRQNDALAETLRGYKSIEDAERQLEEWRKKQRKNRWNPFAKDYSLEIAWLEDAINASKNGTLKAYTFQWKSIQDITEEEIINLKKLIDQGQFDEVTANQVQNIIEQYELWKDALNQMREELTGVSFSSLTLGIVSMFEQGKTSVEDFTDFFEKQMQQAILKAFSRDSIEKQMQPWYELFAQYSEDGLDQTEIDKLREMYSSLMDGAQKDWEELKKATGIDFANKDNSSQLSSSGIERITEQTGTELLGLFRATYDINKRQNDSLSQLVQNANARLASLNAIQQNTFNTAQEAMKIALNTFDIVSNTDRIATSNEASVTELKGINKAVSKKYGN
ncbi:phage tail tape measure protein [Sphingobacterium hungaricum]|uniref:Phage tail tape measure protein n=1 Tax=Sphingobacterium hungaricum TaxID=2082723 RepID=A0A928YP37_9SPHI|nr:phage tail tape measure protein [Sphingobacterium hungaricum]MBE8712529.1 phage tail tape measure protein [Sphingobacterium hungaricum]